MKVAIATVCMGLWSAMAAGAAACETVTATPDRLEFAYHTEVAMPQKALWSRVIAPESWWSDQHTYSGKAANMKLAAHAGGCWCEIWDGGEVAHGRVMYIAPRNTLRLDTALGPLQEMAVSGVLAITLSPGADSNHTKLELTYKVSGASALHLDRMGSVIDRVIGEQFTTLAKVQ